MNPPSVHTSIQCPSCWAEFHPAEVLWVSSSNELLGDPYLGAEALKRFLPSRFDVAGFAIDEKDARCESVACPNCHLILPRILCETWPLFLSILGAPASGKSYFLASAIWQTRQKLGDFNVNFVDADPVANQIISDYEQKLFLSETPGELVSIRKTEETGDLYQRVDFGSREEWFARPFVFSMRPNEDHPLGRTRKKVGIHSRALCLYDNAGEHFLPNANAELSPATSHLAISKALLFVFDPIQHPRFRELARKHSSDPQLLPEFSGNRQDEILQEAAKRIRRKANIAEFEKFDKPLIVVVNKYDVWQELAPALDLRKLNPYKIIDGRYYLNYAVIKRVSDYVEKLIKKLCPEIISVAKAFCQDITYIPASPTGSSPEITAGEGSKLLGIRPRNIEPVWTEVPLLYAISKSKSKLVPRLEATQKSSSVGMHSDSKPEPGN